MRKQSDAPLQVYAGVSTNAIRVGDVFTLTVRAVHPVDTQVEWPPLARDRELVVRDAAYDEHPVDERRAETIARYDMTSFRIGQHVLSTGYVRCADSEGQVHQAPFPDLSIEVNSVIEQGQTAFQDIRGPARWPGRIPRWLWAFATVAVLAAAAGLLARYLLNKPRTIMHAASPTPPHQIALMALDALKRRGWIEAGRAEPFYVELSGIVRHYLEGRFHLRAPEQTTEEFIRDTAQSKVLNTEQQEKVQDFLRQSDLVKFARHQPEQQDMENAFSSAERLVRETKPKEEPAAS